MTKEIRTETPADPNLESRVLSQALLSDAAARQTAETLTPHDFYDLRHRAIFEAMVALLSAGDEVDQLTIDQELRREGKQPDVVLIAQIAALELHTRHLSTHLRLLQGVGRRRALEALGRTMAHEAAKDSCEPATLAGTITQALTKLGGPSGNGRTYELAGVLHQVTADLEQGNTSRGLLTGLADLDRLTLGFQPGDLVLLAARPSIGKTALALGITGAAARNCHAAIIFSLEMSRTMLALRLLAASSRIPLHDLRTGHPSAEQWITVSETMGQLANWSLWIDDSPVLSPAELSATARRLHAEHPLSLIVVDYLQLLHIAGQPNRVQEIAEISRNLKALARELEIPVLALSQLSRNPEQRADRRPQLSDLRDSGSLEQDADTVLFLYNAWEQKEKGAIENTVELIVGKQRNGPRGTILLHWNAACTRFDNLAQEAEVEVPWYSR